MQKLPQKMINVRLAKRVDIASSPAVAEHVAAAETRLADRGRVLLRASGTEPVVRVMVEGSDLNEVNQVCEMLASQVEKELQALVS
jgi:phosphoglucosamine mutase